MARIAIVGSGVVGQATGRGLSKKGHEVIFVDINTETIGRLRQEGFEAYLTDELIGVDADVSMFCVSTPPKDDGSVNLDYLTNAIISHGKWLKCRERTPWHLTVIRSTVPPGTTKNVFLPLLEQCSGLKAGKDFGLCMQPEFLRAKSSEEDFANPWATVIGELDQKSGDTLFQIYSSFGGNTFRVDLESAEFAKYVHNCFNATKISFFNEMWLLGNEIGIDANKALEIAVSTAEGIWNPSYGTVGGQPYGGTCLPKDTKGLEAFARGFGIKMLLLSSCISVNQKMEEMANRGIVPAATIEGCKWQPSPALKEKIYEGGEEN